MREETEDESPEVILGTSKEDYTDAIVDEYGFDPVSVEYKNVSVEPRSSPREPQYIFLPASGNLELLKSKPQSRNRKANYTAEIKDNGYRIQLKSSNRVGGSRSERLQANVEKTVDSIRQAHEVLENDISDFHESLRGQARKRYETRMTEIERQRSIYDNIEFPVREQEDVPDLLDIEPPETRDAVDVEKLRDHSDPAWRVPKEAYLDIMGMLNDLGDAFERRPDLFNGYGEEDIRDLMLFFLEEHFVGSTSGETFNKQGKTDMMLKAEDDPVFAAECAIWNGPKTVTEKISQLIENYLTWRDSKAAIILFVDRKNLPDVLEKIPETVEDHPQFVSSEGQKDESWWQYRFELPDSGKEIDLSVQAYHVPTLR